MKDKIANPSSDFMAYSLWSLFLTFLVLKLIDQIDWSWYYVTAPLTVPVILASILMLVVYIRVRMTVRRAISKKSE